MASKLHQWLPIGLDEEIRVVGVVVEGGGGDIEPGTLGYVIVPFSATVVGWNILTENPGSIVFDVWKAPWASPLPGNPESITGTGKPTLVNGYKAMSDDVSGWSNRRITRGDVIGFEVETVNNLLKATLEVRVLRTGQ